MKRMIGAAAAFTVVAGMAQAMTAQDFAPLSSPIGFSGLDATALAGVVPKTDAGPTNEILRVAGRRGGARAAPARQPGGDNKGAQRQQQRDNNRDVDIDVDVDNGRNHIIEDDAARGVVVGVGIGVAIANSDDPTYSCPDENADGICDDNVAN
jgi:hypothetical protein